MFGRWKKRKLKKHYRPGYVRYAQLVECRRVDGKPRQKVIKHLGAIRDYEREVQGHQFGFWDTADRALDELGLDAEARQEIERVLLAEVPKPSPEMYAERERRRVAIRARAKEVKEAGLKGTRALLYVMGVA